MTKTLFLFTAFSALVACGTSTSYTQTNTPPRPMKARAAETVEVFTTGKPERGFVEVGMIEAQQSSELSTDDMGAVIASLRGEAAKRGCDAIIITGANDAVVGDVSDGEGYTTTLKGYRGACIMYKETD